MKYKQSQSSMTTYDIVRPGLWATRRELPIAKERLKKKIPILNHIEVRRLRLPFYEAIVQELFEDGYNITATCLQKLVAIESELYSQNLVIIRLFHRKEFLLAVRDVAKTAEREALMNANKDLAFQMLLEMVLIVEKHGKHFWWLAGQVYRTIFKIIKECGRSDDEIRCRTRYHYAKFLDEKLRSHNQAIEEFALARKECEGMDWVTNQITYDILYKDICRGYISAVLNKANEISSLNLPEAEGLMEFAMPMMYRYSDRTDVCKQLINWSDILIELNNLEKADVVLVKALKYGYICQSTDLRGLILLKQGLVSYKSHNYQQCIKKLKHALKTANANKLEGLQALTRMHLGFIQSKENQGFQKGIELLEESIEIFKRLNNRIDLRKAEYYLAISKANLIFEDVCGTIRGAFGCSDNRQECLEKWTNWRYRKHVGWNIKSGPEEIPDDDLDFEDKCVSHDFSDDLEMLKSGYNSLRDERDPTPLSLRHNYYFQWKQAMYQTGRSDTPPFSVYWEEDEQDVKARVQSIIAKFKSITASELGFALKTAREPDEPSLNGVE